MEGVTFLEPKVAKILKEEFIEARLHTDLRGAKGDAIKAVRDRFSTSKANPVYVLVDPNSEETLGYHEGILGIKSEDGFLEFLGASAN